MIAHRYIVKHKDGSSQEWLGKLRHNLVYRFEPGSSLWKRETEHSEEVFVALISEKLSEHFLKRDWEFMTGDKHDYIRLSDYIFDYLEGHNWLFDL